MLTTSLSRFLLHHSLITEDRDCFSLSSASLLRLESPVVCSVALISRFIGTYFCFAKPSSAQFSLSIFTFCFLLFRLLRLFFVPVCPCRLLFLIWCTSSSSSPSTAIKIDNTSIYLNLIVPIIFS